MFVMNATSLNHTPVWFPAFMGAPPDFSLTLSLNSDSVGTLYVADDEGDVDVFTVTTASGSPQTVTTIGDGNTDAAGSVLSPIDMTGTAITYVYGTPTGQIVLGLEGNMTTNYSQNQVIDDNNHTSAFNGSLVSGWGIPFEQTGDGSPADYVGTNGKLVITVAGWTCRRRFIWTSRR